MSATSSSTASALSLSGLASGINWTSIVNELLTVESAPETQMNTQETTYEQKKAGYQTLGSDLTTLNNDITTLSKPAFFGSRTTSLSNSGVATATAATGTSLGNYTFKVTQLATNAVQVGSTASGQLSSTDNVSSLVLSGAGFANPVTAGTFTVDGKTITISTSDTLQSVFDQISTATGGAVTGSYSATGINADKITLSSSSPITLGSDTDTSNFLQSAELYNNGTSTVTSAAALGGVNLSTTLDYANLATPVSDGGSGAGEFLINGVPITFNASTDTVTDVLQEINNSAAGVTATYDPLNNNFELTDTTAGNVGISLQDVTGNFLAATGLSTGTLQAGKNLQYSINGGGTLTSQSNTVDAGTSGVTGLSITALGVGTTTISVTSDTATISAAIGSFVTDYNTVQNYISSQTATTTSATGTVTPGLFTGDLDVENIAFTLRQIADATPPGGTTGVENLNDIGIVSNGNDNTLTAPDSTTLNNALNNNLNAVQNLFTNPTTGIATTLGSYVTDAVSSKGVLASNETNMTNEIKAVANSISTLQAKISSDQTMLDNEFANMETAINSINAEKQYLNDYFNSSTASSQSAPTAAGSGTSSS